MYDMLYPESPLLRKMRVEINTRAAVQAHTDLYGGDLSRTDQYMPVLAGEEEISSLPSSTPLSPISSRSASPISSFSTPVSTTQRKRVRTDWVEEEERCPPASTERRKRVRTDWVEEEERWLTSWLRRQPQHSCYDWVKCLNDLRLDPAAHAVFSVSIL